MENKDKIPDLKDNNFRKKLNSFNWIVYLIIFIVLFWKYWYIPVAIVMLIFNMIWNLISPANYTLFLYKDLVTKDVVRNYDSYKSCQEKGIEFTKGGKDYDSYSCGKRCKSDTWTVVDCQY